MTAGLSDFEYHKAPDKTRSMKRDGIITAGDLGHLTEDGWLYTSDRRTDRILSGGANIYPAEIAAVLVTCPVVADAAVFGVPDPDWGEAVQAVIELVPGVEGSDALADEISAFAAHYRRGVFDFGLCSKQSAFGFGNVDRRCDLHHPGESAAQRLGMGMPGGLVVVMVPQAHLFERQDAKADRGLASHWVPKHTLARDGLVDQGKCSGAGGVQPVARCSTTMWV